MHITFFNLIVEEKTHTGLQYSFFISGFEFILKLRFDGNIKSLISSFFNLRLALHLLFLI